MLSQFQVYSKVIQLYIYIYIYIYSFSDCFPSQVIAFQGFTGPSMCAEQEDTWTCRKSSFPLTGVFPSPTESTLALLRDMAFLSDGEEELGRQRYTTALQTPSPFSPEKKALNTCLCVCPSIINSVCQSLWGSAGWTSQKCQPGIY